MVRQTHSYALSMYPLAFFVQDLRPTDRHWTIADTGKSDASHLFLRI
jgi:hypothetical protein